MNINALTAFKPIVSAISITAILVGNIFFAANVQAEGMDLAALKTLRVCADPYMLPFSNLQEEGYENKIAQLLAKKMGLALEYEWFPQRIGFVRNTLRAEMNSSNSGSGYKCDLIISVPGAFELAATSKPYFKTTYMLIYVKGRGFDAVKTPAQLKQFVTDKKPDLKFGVTDSGPAQLWLFSQEMLANMEPYQGQPGNPKWHPGRKMMEELAAGNIDMSIIWGPTAGYYAQKFKTEKGLDFVLLPMAASDPDYPEARFAYDVSMAVRHGEQEWKQRIDELLVANKDAINSILESFAVPIVK